MIVIVIIALVIIAIVGGIDFSWLDDRYQK